MQKAAPLLTALVAFTILGAPAQAQTNLASLGSNNFTVLFEFDATATQTATNVTFAASEAGIFAGSFTNAYNWTAYSDTNIWTFGLFLSVSQAASMGEAFTVELLDSSLDVLNGLVAKYQGQTPADATPAFMSMTPVLGEGSLDFSDVAGFQMTWDGAGGGTAVIDGIGVVPEPSTWAMLVFGSATVVFVALRRRSLAKARE
jgi:hypothetical protein